MTTDLKAELSKMIALLSIILALTLGLAVHHYKFATKADRRAL